MRRARSQTPRLAPTHFLFFALAIGLSLPACGKNDQTTVGHAGNESKSAGRQNGSSGANGRQDNGTPLPAVTVAPVIVENVAPRQSFIGHVVPIQALQVVARVTAFIEDVAVTQGSVVQPGQVLFQLEKTQYKAALEAAKAQLASSQAALRLAELAYQRAFELVQKNAETQANLDQARATRDQNQASVQAAQANVDQAELNLSYCTISSPIAGRIGAVSLTKGNLVTSATPPLATINQLDPIRVQFGVSDQLIVTAQEKSKQTVEQIAVGRTVNIELPNGSAYDEPGKVVFVNNEVQAQTGTVSVYADFPNGGGVLLPGAYVTVYVRPRRPQEHPVVPVAAVQMEQAGAFVLVVDTQNKVVRQPVELGSQIGQTYVVQRGLNGGERVVTEGIQKVHAGETVNPTAAPTQPQAGTEGENARGTGQHGQNQGG